MADRLWGVMSQAGDFSDQDDIQNQWFTRSPSEIEQERQSAEQAGRDAYAEAIRNGQDVQARTPAELLALGRARLAGNTGQQPDGDAVDDGADGAEPAASVSQTTGSQFPNTLDPIIEREVARYNRMNQADPGDDVYLDPDLIKAQVRVESGYDTKAYNSDPMQVNKPGDWDDCKFDMGLRKGQPPGPELGLRAGLGWLDYKSYRYDNRGNPGDFIGYPAAMTAYNSRSGSGNPHYWADVQNAYRDIKGGGR